MITHVYTLAEAEEWFLENRDYSVVCVKGDKSERCYSYPEAVNFYSENDESINIIGIIC